MQLVLEALQVRTYCRLYGLLIGNVLDEKQNGHLKWYDCQFKWEAKKTSSCLINEFLILYIIDSHLETIWEATSWLWFLTKVQFGLFHSFPVIHSVFLCPMTVCNPQGEEGRLFGENSPGVNFLSASVSFDSTSVGCLVRDYFVTLPSVLNWVIISFFSFLRLCHTLQMLYKSGLSV